MDSGRVEEFENMMQTLRGAGLALFVGGTEDHKWAFGFVRQYQVYYNDGLNAQARVIVQGVV